MANEKQEYEGRRGSIIGYARVSTNEQTVDLQVDAPKEAGASRIFIDEGVSGAKAERPQLTACLNYLREGDTLLVYKLDRLVRSVKNLIPLVDEVLNPRGIHFRSLTENLSTSTPSERLFFTVIAAIAEMERELIRERSRAGMEAARARGRVGGRKPVLSPKQVESVRKLYAAGDSAAELAQQFGVGRTTIFKALKNN